MRWVCDWCGYQASRLEEVEQHESAGCVPSELEEELWSMSRQERLDTWAELHLPPPTRDVPVRDGLL